MREIFIELPKLTDEEKVKYFIKCGDSFACSKQCLPSIDVDDCAPYLAFVGNNVTDRYGAIMRNHFGDHCDYVVFNCVKHNCFAKFKGDNIKCIRCLYKECYSSLECNWDSKEDCQNFMDLFYNNHIEED